MNTLKPPKAINIHVTAETHAQLKQTASLMGVSLTALVTNIVTNAAQADPRIAEADAVLAEIDQMLGAQK